MNVKIELEYFGEHFAGWQLQPELRTIQGELTEALQTFLNSQIKKQSVELTFEVLVQGSGRTDSGVHAKGQVASFRWPDEIPLDFHKLRAAANSLTGKELSVVQAEQVPEEFDARLSPHIKCYSYHLLIRPFSYGYYYGRAWYVRGGKLNIAEMIRAAHHFRGKHDFSSFRGADCTAKTTERTIAASEFTRIGREELVFTIVGKGFLKQMVRIMMGTLLDVGLGKITADDIPRIIAARDRSAAGITAPACGLVLEWVKYGTEWDFRGSE